MENFFLKSEQIFDKIKNKSMEHDMTLSEKLNILGEAARYDASCASSGSGRQGKIGGIGNAHMAGICHSWTEDGRCLSLLKILYSNACIYDCAYCANRSSSNVPRATFDPNEIAKLTIEFYRRNYIEGLFLSSGVVKNSDYTMELLIKTLSLLRNNYGYNGYIHVKAIPSAEPALIKKLGMLSDRISINIELPSRSSLKLLAPQKSIEGIINPMKNIRDAKFENIEERRRFKSAPLFAPAGQATQMIVGATNDTDLSILRLSDTLYKQYKLQRVYFSAYLPVGRHPSLPGPDIKIPLLREHRLYQADWLMRFYEFGANELLDEREPCLDMSLDPKCAWALRNISRFPVEVNTADYLELLRIPGVGVNSARKIVEARKQKQLNLDDIKKLGIVMKRAQYFLTAGGRYGGKIRTDSPQLHSILSEPERVEQLSFFGNSNGLVKIG